MHSWHIGWHQCSLCRLARRTGRSKRCTGAGDHMANLLSHLVALLKVLFKENDVFVVHAAQQVNLLEDILPATQLSGLQLISHAQATLRHLCTTTHAQPCTFAVDYDMLCCRGLQQAHASAPCVLVLADLLPDRRQRHDLACVLHVSFLIHSKLNDREACTRGMGAAGEPSGCGKGVAAAAKASRSSAALSPPVPSVFPSRYRSFNLTSVRSLELRGNQKARCGATCRMRPRSPPCEPRTDSPWPYCCWLTIAGRRRGRRCGLVHCGSLWSWRGRRSCRGRYGRWRGGRACLCGLLFGQQHVVGAGYASDAGLRGRLAGLVLRGTSRTRCRGLVLNDGRDGLCWARRG